MPDVYYVRSMDAQEAVGIEHALNGVHGHVQQVRYRTGVDTDIVLEGFDPIDLINGHEGSVLAGSNGESFKLPRWIRDGVKHGQHLFCSVLVRSVLQPAQGTLERERKAVLGYRFEEIIDCCDFKCPDRILVMRGHKDNRRHALRPYGMDDRKAIDARHLNIEEYEVRILFANESNGFPSIARLRN